MDKVKIKRVKRVKKQASAKEKIVAGLGLGATLLGGAGAINSKPSSTQFVRSTDAESSSASSKIKSSLKKIFSARPRPDTGPYPGTEYDTFAEKDNPSTGGVIKNLIGVPEAQAYDPSYFTFTVPPSFPADTPDNVIAAWHNLMLGQGTTVDSQIYYHWYNSQPNVSAIPAGTTVQQILNNTAKNINPSVYKIVSLLGILNNHFYNSGPLPPGITEAQANALWYGSASMSMDDFNKLAASLPQGGASYGLDSANAFGTFHELWNYYQFLNHVAASGNNSGNTSSGNIISSQYPDYTKPVFTADANLKATVGVKNTIVLGTGGGGKGVATSWHVAGGGALPAGLNFVGGDIYSADNNLSGMIEGIPTQAGTYDFTVWAATDVANVGSAATPGNPSGGGVPPSIQQYYPISISKTFHLVVSNNYNIQSFSFSQASAAVPGTTGQFTGKGFNTQAKQLNILLPGGISVPAQNVSVTDTNISFTFPNFPNIRHTLGQTVNFEQVDNNGQAHRLTYGTVNMEFFASARLDPNMLPELKQLAGGAALGKLSDQQIASLMMKALGANPAFTQSFLNSDGVIQYTGSLQRIAENDPKATTMPLQTLLGSPFYNAVKADAAGGAVTPTASGSSVGTVFISNTVYNDSKPVDFVINGTNLNGATLSIQDQSNNNIQLAIVSNNGSKITGQITANGNVSPGQYNMQVLVGGSLAGSAGFTVVGAGSQNTGGSPTTITGTAISSINVNYNGAAFATLDDLSLNSNNHNLYSITVLGNNFNGASVSAVFSKNGSSISVPLTSMTRTNNSITFSPPASSNWQVGNYTLAVNINSGSAPSVGLTNFTVGVPQSAATFNNGNYNTNNQSGQPSGLEGSGRSGIYASNNGNLGVFSSTVPVNTAPGGTGNVQGNTGTGLSGNTTNNVASSIDNEVEVLDESSMVVGSGVANNGSGGVNNVASNNSANADGEVEVLSEDGTTTVTGTQNNTNTNTNSGGNTIVLDSVTNVGDDEATGPVVQSDLSQSSNSTVLDSITNVGDDLADGTNNQTTTNTNTTDVPVEVTDETLVTDGGTTNLGNGNQNLQNSGSNTDSNQQANDSTSLINSLKQQIQDLQNQITVLNNKLASQTNGNNQNQVYLQQILSLQQQVNKLTATIAQLQQANNAQTFDRSSTLLQYPGTADNQSQPANAGTYTVKKGDTLWGISKRFYGSGTMWRKILEANTDKVKNPRTMRIGITLVIPSLSPQDAAKAASLVKTSARTKVSAKKLATNVPATVFARPAAANNQAPAPVIPPVITQSQAPIVKDSVSNVTSSDPGDSDQPVEVTE